MTTDKATTDERITAAHIEAALAKLGGNPLDIADKLLGMNCQGMPRAPGKCPIAQYLLLKFPGIQWLRVGITNGGWKGGEFDVPSAARKFVRAFDDGYYPNLIKRGTWNT